MTKCHVPYGPPYMGETALNGPLLSSTTAKSRLKKYLRNAQIDNGENFHSLRCGCAVSLALSGSPLADVMSHVGWTNSKTEFYYLKLANVFRAGVRVRKFN